MSDPRRALGAAGEERAARWYEANGYTVIDRNWRCARGEIDLILRRGREIVFSEVKTRRSDRFGTPAAAVTPTKQRRIRGLALAWLSERDERASQLRFDVVSVMGGQIDVIEGAF